MYITIYYQDVLSNWYRQEILVYYNASTIFDKGNYIGRLTYEVKKEIEIKETEIEENVI